MVSWDSLAGEALPHVSNPLPHTPTPGTSLLAMAEVQEGKHKLAKTFKAKVKLACHHSTLFCWPKHVTLPNPRHRKIDSIPLWEETTKSHRKKYECNTTKAIYHNLQRVKQMNANFGGSPLKQNPILPY